MALCWGFALLALCYAGECVCEDCTRGSFKLFFVTTIDLQNAVRIIIVVVARARLSTATTCKKNATKEKKRTLARTLGHDKTSLRWEWFQLWRSHWNKKMQPWICIGYSNVFYVPNLCIMQSDVKYWSGMTCIMISRVNYSVLRLKVYIFTCTLSPFNPALKMALTKDSVPTFPTLEQKNMVPEIRGHFPWWTCRRYMYKQSTLIHLLSKKAVEIIGCSLGSMYSM